MHKSESVLKNKTHEILWNFEIQWDDQIPAKKKNRPSINKEKKRELAVYRILLLQRTIMKIRESEKSDKYFDVARELWKQSNRLVMMIPWITGGLEKVLKSLERRLE